MIEEALANRDVVITTKKEVENLKSKISDYVIMLSDLSVPEEFRKAFLETLGDFINSQTLESKGIELIKEEMEEEMEKEVLSLESQITRLTAQKKKATEEAEKEKKYLSEIKELNCAALKEILANQEKLVQGN